MINLVYVRISLQQVARGAPPHQHVDRGRGEIGSQFVNERRGEKGVADARGTFGSVQNRIEHTLNNLASYEENLQASESRIRDVDMASEMVEFTKLNILQQAGTSMLAQANQIPQSVLSLLRG